MNKSTEPVLLSLDIGARKHAFAWALGEHRETGSVDNTPATLRALLTGLMRRASGLPQTATCGSSHAQNGSAA